MSDQEILAERFESSRPHLTAVARRILGSEHEADDAVQEAWVRLSRADTAGVDNLTGWLTTVVSRICLDLLRSRSSRREDPAEVPETVAEQAGPEHQAVLADAIGPALLLVLDTLSPSERLAFVLHDMFAVPFAEIAEIVGCSPASARQLASRGRRRVQGSAATGDDDAARRREVVDAFLAASRDGNFAELLRVLDPGVVVRADAVAAAMGADVLIEGATAVAEAYNGRARAALPALIDGEPGAMWMLRGTPKVVFAFTVGDDGRITAIDLLADPDTLGGMTIVTR